MADPEAARYHNILAHWLNLYTVRKALRAAHKQPAPKWLAEFTRRKLSKGDLARMIYRILGCKEATRAIVACVASDPRFVQEADFFGKVRKIDHRMAQSQLDELRDEVKLHVRAAGAGLVLPIHS